MKFWKFWEFIQLKHLVEITDCGLVIKYNFDYHNLLLLRKQNQTALIFPFCNTHIFLHPFERTRGCTISELKICYNVEPLKLKP